MLKRLIAASAAALLGTTLGLVPPQTAQAAEPSPYTAPGDHYVNGRYWKTDCEMYSSEVVRCRTDIYATKISTVGGRYVAHKGYAFNNLTYLPSGRGQWASNPLGNTGTWRGSDGRNWRTECDTAATGQGACRSYAMTSVVVQESGRFRVRNMEVFNNIVLFSSSWAPAVTTIPAAVPARSDMPVEQEPVAPHLAINLAREAQWVKIAQCESGNRWHINTGNGYYGGLQFNLATWRSVDGQDFAAYPHHATREEQITVANRLYEIRGFQPWTCKPW